jgi:hypothetical protein
MTATNHTLTGVAFTAVTVNFLPIWLLLPAAFMLHFAMDALPHFGQATDKSKWRDALARLKWFLPIDAGVAASVLLTLMLVQPEHWLLLMAGGIVCASPDLWSISRFVRFLRSGNTALNNDWFAQFHHRIQWGERLWGAWIELAWCVVFGFVFAVQL